MPNPNFSQLWEDVDNSIDKITCLLKGAVCISEYTQHDEDTALGLVYLALERVEETERQLRELNNHYLKLEEEKDEPAATPTKTEGRA